MPLSTMPVTVSPVSVPAEAPCAPLSTAPRLLRPFPTLAGWTSSTAYLPGRSPVNAQPPSVPVVRLRTTATPPASCPRRSIRTPAIPASPGSRRPLSLVSAKTAPLICDRATLPGSSAGKTPVSSAAGRSGSGSQTSPMPSPSLSSWPGLGSLGQLSTSLGTSSPSSVTLRCAVVVAVRPWSSVTRRPTLVRMGCGPTVEWYTWVRTGSVFEASYVPSLSKSHSYFVMKPPPGAKLPEASSVTVSPSRATYGPPADTYGRARRSSTVLTTVRPGSSTPELVNVPPVAAVMSWTCGPSPPSGDTPPDTSMALIATGGAAPPSCPANRPPLT